MAEVDVRQTPLKVIAAIPCYNEARFIGSVVARARKFVDEVIVIDDGSDDDSAEVAQMAGAIVYQHSHNQGYGAAINSCLEKGRKHSAGILVTIDGDGQHDPRDIKNLVGPILNGEADVVVGSRFMDRESRAPLYRRIGQRVLTSITNIGSGQKISDSQSGCRAYSRRALEKLNFSESGMAISSEMQFVLSQSGLRVAEVPIDVSYDIESKRNPFGHGFNVMVRILIMFILRHPLLAFGLPGIAFLVGGLVLGLRVLDIYSDTGNVAVGTALIAILLASGGFLAMFGALMLQAMRELLRRETSRLVRRMEGKHFLDNGE